MVYEALIRHLADPEGPQPIYVLTYICPELMEGDSRCENRLTPRSDKYSARGYTISETSYSGRGSTRHTRSPFQQTLMGPIVEKPNGLRVEGSYVCGALCGRGPCTP